MIIEIIILVFLLILSAFFSAAEVAFTTLTDARVEAIVKRKMPRARLIKKLKSNPRKLLVTILIGNNIVNIASASIATVVVTEFFQSAVIGITTGVMTFMVLVFGEILPKSYASNHPKRFAIVASPIIYFLGTVSWPIVIIFEKMTNFLAGKHKPDMVNEEELRAMARAGKKQGAIENDEEFILHRLFEMNDIKVGDIMTKRDKINYVRDNITIDEVADVMSDNPHTRYPVVNKNLDDVIGLTLAKDALAEFNNDHEDRSIKKIVRPILRVDVDMKIDRLMQKFQKEKTHMALVVDKKDKTLGLVTLENVLEELVGEIIDETDLK
jgi:putative hemolysin